MKIAIACHPTHGGSGVVASELGMEMARRGHEVHFVSYQIPFRVDQLHENVYFHEVEVTSYPLFRYPPYALVLATKLVDVVRAHGVRVLHVHYAIPHSISAILTRQMCANCGIRIITTLHGTDITLVGSDPSFSEITRFGIESSDVVTAVSESLRESTRSHFGVEKEIQVIPNFVDTEVYSPLRRDPELRRRFASDGERLVVHISNFRPVKRVRDVVRIFASIVQRVPSRLLMIGHGPERSVAEEEVERLGLRDRVCFLGVLDAVADLLAVADLFLLPSDGESFGLAALEAMACAVPVIAARAGGIPELVEDGVTGILGEVGDVETMGARGAGLLDDPARLEMVRRAARDRAVENFSMEMIGDRYEKLYASVLGDPAAPRKALGRPAHS